MKQLSVSNKHSKKINKIINDNLNYWTYGCTTEKEKWMMKEYPEILHFHDTKKYVHKLIVIAYCISNPIYAYGYVYTSIKQKYQFLIYSYIKP